MLIAPELIASSAGLQAIGSCSLLTMVLFFSTRSRFCSLSAVPHPAVGLVLSNRLQLLPLYCLSHRVSRIASRGVAPSDSTITWASLPRSCPPPSEESCVTWHSSFRTPSFFYPPLRTDGMLQPRRIIILLGASHWLARGEGGAPAVAGGEGAGEGHQAMLRVFKLLLVGFSNS